MTKEEPTLEMPLVLTDEQIGAISVEELRAAYRELVAYHEELQAKRAAKSVEKVQELRKQGKATGEPPFGFTTDPDGKLQKERSEQRVIARVKQLRLEGLSFYAIAKRLNESARYSPREGDEFFPTQIRRILDREQTAADSADRSKSG